MNDRTERITVTTRKRFPVPGKPDTWRVLMRRESWKPHRTAIVVCDMWNRHWCKGATRRVEELAPAVNELLSRAREKGVLIIHAPSGTMDYYKDHPARRRALAAPRASSLPRGIEKWCSHIPAEDGARWPIDQSDGGCDCSPPCRKGSPWTHQIEAIEIRDEDAISDSGMEIWNLLAERGIENVILLGVHTNMCVMGRPFGLRNLARFGKNVVLMRDLTDTMYNSRRAPFVPHFSGTDLIVNYIEKFICPTIISSAFTERPPFRFKNDTRPRVVLISAEAEYGSCETFPALADFLLLDGGLHTDVLQGTTSRKGPGRNDIPGTIVLEEADLVLLFVRRRALPPRQMRRFKAYLERGRPLIAFRTSSHAFSLRTPCPEGLVEWKTFDREVLGGTYNFYPHGALRVTVVPKNAQHPILKGLKGPYRLRETMYRHWPLAHTARVLLMGTCVDEGPEEPRYHIKPGERVPDEPVAWTNRYKGAKIFYTSLGSSRASFKEPWFRRMVLNAIFWALERPVPERALRGLEEWK